MNTRAWASWYSMMRRISVFHSRGCRWRKHAEPKVIQVYHCQVSTMTIFLAISYGHHGQHHLNGIIGPSIQLSWPPDSEPWPEPRVLQPHMSSLMVIASWIFVFTSVYHQRREISPEGKTCKSLIIIDWIHRSAYFAWDHRGTPKSGQSQLLPSRSNTMSPSVLADSLFLLR